MGKVAIACGRVLAWACGAVGGNNPLKMEMAMLPGSKWSVHQEHGGGVDEMSGLCDHRTREGGREHLEDATFFRVQPKEVEFSEVKQFLSAAEKTNIGISAVPFEHYITVDVSCLSF